MKSAFYSLCCLAAGLVILAAPARAQTADQTVTLTAGWNAVWLEVEPLDSSGEMKSPQDVFTNMAIQTVATPKPLAGLSEFFAGDPGTINTFNQDEWEQWKRTDPAGANNLPLIFGNRPYLIQVATGTASFSLTLTGKVRFSRPTWTADRYNLVGFGLQGTPTFNAFFNPSGTKHPVARIFSLNAATGSWQLVTGTATMASGRAYWVYSSGPSDYMGPVAVDFGQAASGELNFGGPADAVTVGSGTDALQLDLKELVFTNRGPSPASPELDLITADPGAGSLALRVVRPAADSLAFELGNQVDSTPGVGGSSSLDEVIQPLKSAILTLGARRLWSTGLAGRTNVYRLKTGPNGASFWLPVSALSNDLQAPADLVVTGPAAAAGLWVGEVSVAGVTSIVEDGAPTRSAAGNAPLRVLLHSDGAGSVRLLSHVTIMQTKTADPEISPVPVLVVDPKRIPFFEGIKERNGKRVGLRLQSVAYAMPRKLDAASQSALLADPAYPTLTESGISDFLLARQSRPPSLAEVYHFSWPVTGAVGAGKTLETTLALDPFHRGNPFRHAYHNKHAKGPNVKRSMTIVFDSEQEFSDRLHGSFTETLQGLIQSNLTVTGRLELRRVSPVATLEGAQ